MYLSDNKCLPCDESCVTCEGEADFCMSCDAARGMYLSQNVCMNNSDLAGICRVFISSGGCASCATGFYRQERTCVECKEECASCLNGDSCLTCNDEHFMTVEDTCRPKTDIVGCGRCRQCGRVHDVRGGLLRVGQAVWAVQRDGRWVETCDGTVNGVCRVGLCPGGRLVCPAHVRRPLHGGRGVGVHGVRFLAQANTVQHSTRSTRSLVCRLHRRRWTHRPCRDHCRHPRCCPRDRVMHKFRAKSRL